MCLCAIAAPCNNEYYCMPKIGKHRIKCSVCGSQSHQPTCIWKKNTVLFSSGKPESDQHTFTRGEQQAGGF